MTSHPNHPILAFRKNPIKGAYKTVFLKWRFWDDWDASLHLVPTPTDEDFIDNMDSTSF